MSNLCELENNLCILQKINSDLIKLIKQGNVDQLIIEERNASINDISRDLTDLKEISINMSDLIECQGNDMNEIENNTTDADDNTETGVIELKKAKRYAKILKSKKFWIVGGAVVGGSLFGGVGYLIGTVPAIICIGIGSIGGMRAGTGANSLLLKKE